MLKKLLVWGLLFLVIVGVPIVGWGVYQTRHYTGSEISYTIDVDRDRPLVWFYLINAGYRQLWMPHLDSLTAIGGIPYSVGEETLVTLDIDGVPYEYTEKVTAIDPPTYEAVDLTAVGFKGNIVYDLHKLPDGGTRVKVTRRVHYQTLMAVMMEPLLERTERKNLEEGLKKMKRLAETAPENSDSNYSE